MTSSPGSHLFAGHPAPAPKPWPGLEPLPSRGTPAASSHRKGQLQAEGIKNKTLRFRRRELSQHHSHHRRGPWGRRNRGWWGGVPGCTALHPSPSPGAAAIVSLHWEPVLRRWINGLGDQRHPRRLQKPNGSRRKGCLVPRPRRWAGGAGGDWKRQP